MLLGITLPKFIGQFLKSLKPLKTCQKLPVFKVKSILDCLMSMNGQRFVLPTYVVSQDCFARGRKHFES